MVPRRPFEDVQRRLSSRTRRYDKRIPVKRAESWFAVAGRLVRGADRFKRWPRKGPDRWARWAPPAAAFLAVMGVGAISFPFTVDDAFIVARYAERWASGRGVTMNDGPATDGVTGPLWLFVLGLGVHAGVDPIVVAKVVGLGCAAGAAAFATWVAGREHAAAGWVAAAVLSVQPTLGIWGVAGLETGMAVLATTIAAVSCLSARPRPALAGLGIGTLAWLRPELALVSAVFLGALALRDRRAGRYAFAIAAPLALGVMAYRLALFDSPLPLSLAAKPPGGGHGIAYVGHALIATTGALGFAWAAFGAFRARAFVSRSLLTALVVHGVAIVLAGGDWMPGYRLVAPVLPLYGWLLASEMAGSMRRPLALVALAAATIVPAIDLVVQVPRTREAGIHRETHGRALAASLARHRTVALVDVGFLARESGVSVVDLGGLTDPTIGRAEGDHLAKRIDPGYLAARDPDAIVLHAAAPPVVDSEGRLLRLAGYPVERSLAAMPWVRAHFAATRIVRYAPDYYYVVLERREPAP